DSCTVARQDENNRGSCTIAAPGKQPASSSSSANVTEPVLNEQKFEHLMHLLQRCLVRDTGARITASELEWDLRVLEAISCATATSLYRHFRFQRAAIRPIP
ncbi:unnamed protein product, partial [Amoebophrya sp. A120]